MRLEHFFALHLLISRIFRAAAAFLFLALFSLCNRIKRSPCTSLTWPTDCSVMRKLTQGEANTCTHSLSLAPSSLLSSLHDIRFSSSDRSGQSGRSRTICRVRCLHEGDILRLPKSVNRDPEAGKKRNTFAKDANPKPEIRHHDHLSCRPPLLAAGDVEGRKKNHSLSTSNPGSEPRLTHTCTCMHASTYIRQSTESFHFAFSALSSDRHVSWYISIFLSHV